MLEAELAFSNKTRHQIQEKSVKNVISETLKVLGVRGLVFVDVAVVGEPAMQKLNKFWRGKNRVTDVLSFSQLDRKKGSEEFVSPPDGVLRLGQMVLCPSYIKKQSRRSGTDETFELKMNIVHGILHLLGYDHENVGEKKAEEMMSLQKKILNKIQ